MTDYLNICMTPQEIGAVSNLGLAHIGDCVYELLVRSYIVAHGGVTNQTMHSMTVDMVKAHAQSAAMEASPAPGAGSPRRSVKTMSYFFPPLRPRAWNVTSFVPAGTRP